MRLLKGRGMQITFYLFLVILIYAVAVRFAKLQEVAYLLKTVNPAWIAAVVILQAATYAAAGQAMRAILSTLGHRFSLWFLYKLDLAMLFLAHTIPSGAFTGVIYMVRVLKKRGVPPGQGTSTSLILLMSGYAGFFLLLVVGLLASPALGSDANFPLQGIGYALAGALIFFVFADRVIAKRNFLSRCFHFLISHTRFHSHLESRLRQLGKFFDELAEGRELFAKSKRRFIAPAISQFLVLFLDCLTLWMIFYAFGKTAPFAVIVLSYAVGRFLGAVSLLPGGLGSFDAAQIFMLKALGVPLAAATLVTLVFRVFAYWIPTPVGLYYYRKLLRSANIPQMEDE